MTRGELKFALQVEAALNRVTQPELRQLAVETLTVLSLVAEHSDGRVRWDQIINVKSIVMRANSIFIDEQQYMNGDVLLCCAKSNQSPLKCGGVAGICQHFYDSAPSGRYGTMSYLCKAVARMLHMPIDGDGNVDCHIQ